MERAALSETATRALVQQIHDHAHALAEATSLVDDPDLCAAAQAEPVDTSGLIALVERADRAHRAAETETAVATAAAERCESLADELATRIAVWQPASHQHELAVRLAGLVEGRSADNRLQLRLSGYVLAYRLQQVIHAANARLARMSDQRYTLEHTVARSGGETRGGLGLLVRDDWTGESRDPATLSGGETFVVSLALALGLADVITQEAGGAGLDTLFVDEGFGSLDADTLSDVLDTLDGLREGGRVVGLVSHLPEVRDRVPTRLEVLKSRGGSSVRTHAT